MNKKILSSLVGKAVNVNRGGSDSRIGMLLTVEEDYFALLTKEDGVLYYKGHHVRSLTDNIKKGINVDFVIPADFSYIQGHNFKNILKGLKHHWVTINKGGYEKYQGVLDDVNDDYITIVFHEEVILVAMFHIRTISYDLKIEEPDKESKDKEKKNRQKQSEGKVSHPS